MDFDLNPPLCKYIGNWVFLEKINLSIGALPRIYAMKKNAFLWSPFTVYRWGLNLFGLEFEPPNAWDFWVLLFTFCTQDTLEHQHLPRSSRITIIPSLESALNFPCPLCNVMFFFRENSIDRSLVWMQAFCSLAFEHYYIFLSYISWKWAVNQQKTFAEHELGRKMIKEATSLFIFTFAGKL